VPSPLSRVLALAALCACSSAPPRVPAAPPPAPPRLVVLVVIDQLPAWTWPAKSAATSDGLARIVREGRVWTARYPYGATQTAPGHAALGTGAPPSITGIIGNEWWDRELGRERKAAEDPDGGSSAIWLRVDGIADALLRERPTAKAVAVALKDRSAILALGHAGVPIWYDDACPCMVSPQPLAWLDAAAGPAIVGPRTTTVWTPADPARLAELSGAPDDAPGELGIPGWDGTFPHDPATTPSAAKALIDTPLGDTTVADTAIAAINGESLGADDVPDLLVVSFSAHDYTNHAFGQDSWESWDAWLALDRSIGDLLRALDAEVGAGRWALILTSEHGGPELVERRIARGEPAERHTYDDVAAVAERAAASVAGDGDWIASARVPSIYLSDAALALAPDLQARALDAIVAALRAMPGIGYAERADAFPADPVQCANLDGDRRAACRSIDRERSGEVFYTPAAGTILYKAEWVDAIAHGSLNDYDRDVPLVLLAPGVAPGNDAGAASPLQVAPTLAALLGVAPPGAAQEPPLPALPTPPAP
jgi:hypothetical protein